MKTLIKNGLIIDGSGKKGFYGHISFSEGRITGVGEPVGRDFDHVIDAEGLVVCPGFIDTHSHSDLKVLLEPHMEAKVRQGITTEVLGQDGISMAPLPLEYLKDWRRNLAGLDGDSDEIDWSYRTTEGYLKLLGKSGVGLNQCYLVPHGNVRMEAMGLDNRQPSRYELEQMKDIVRREMDAGAFGLSTGLIYIPCAYSKTNELIEICKAVREYDGVFVVHQRSEADSIMDSMKEILEVARRSGVRVHFSHFKVCGRKNWPKIDSVMELLDEANREGISVSFDQYPYAAGSTMLGVILPPWAHSGGTGRLLERLKDQSQRKRMKDDIVNGIEGWDNFIDFAGVDGIYITSVKTGKNNGLIGKSLKEIGEIRGIEPLDAALDLILEEENAVGMVDFYGTEEHITRFMKRPEQNVCTDGLLGGRPHPRVYGSFPRVLGRYVREQGVMELSEAVAKMTGKAADVLGLTDRGILRTGAAADIVIFDARTVRDRGSYTDPAQYPEGIITVIINGKTVLRDGVLNSGLAGSVLRRSPHCLGKK
ncbi:N-acyl-D-amino-acid deacylase [Anaerobacterium chartisolvens]|uniref:N-acyl-D-amino-acid deacylase n=1 Tax=Anaerobacterium chartisolvens TaxID=1297424 RepID=A0A369AK88_9FIRM|nr:D-aminoacylase [Anaerobacterium chartisolvens]RCX09581.1 N-acyl-D-amino-acid deacylase [Anaerobacterium chartisolvens]